MVADSIRVPTAIGRGGAAVAAVAVSVCVGILGEESLDGGRAEQLGSGVDAHDAACGPGRYRAGHPPDRRPYI
jgi:hypothetical protein